MAFSYVGGAVTTATSSLTTRTVTVPAGVADGDTIILVASKSGGTTSPTISGITATNIADVAFSGHAASAWIVDNASASLAGTVVTFTTTTALRCSAGIIVVRGLTASALDTHTKTNGLSSSVIAPSAVAGAQDITVVLATTSANTASVSFTTPSGFTKAIEAIDAGSAGAAGFWLGYNATGTASGATQAATTVAPTASTNYSAWTILLKLRTATDTVRPISQISNAGSYVAVGSGTLVDAFADESDSTYAETGDTPTASAQVVKLGEITAGDVSVSVRARYGQAATSGTLVTKLVQGASTVIATWTDSLTGSFVSYNHTTSSGQTASITDRSDLRVETDSTAS